MIARGREPRGGVGSRSSSWATTCNCRWRPVFTLSRRSDIFSRRCLSSMLIVRLGGIPCELPQGSSRPASIEFKDCRSKHGGFQYAEDYFKGGDRKAR